MPTMPSTMPPKAGDSRPLWPEGAPGAIAGQEQPRIEHFVLPPDAGAGRRAAVVVCPGGGYAHRAAHEGEPVARWLNGLGVTAFVLHYRVAPYRHPVPLLDAQRAIRYVRHHADEWAIDPNRVGILGFSAGGHLAATVATHFDAGSAQHEDPIERQSCRPNAVVLCYPVISFEEYRHAGSMRNLLGDDPPEALRRALSNHRQVTAETPPAFLWHTAEDAGVPVENSLLFAAALSRCKVPFELHVFPHGRHGLGLASGDPHAGAWTALCATWLRSIGFAPPATP